MCAKTCCLKFSNQRLQNSSYIISSVNIIIFIKESLCMPHIQLWIQKSCSANMTRTHNQCSPSPWFSYSQKLQKRVPKWNRILFVVKLYSLGIFLHIWECPEECKTVPCFFSAVLRYVRIKTGLSLEQVGCERKQVWSALLFGARPGQLC